MIFLRVTFIKNVKYAIMIPEWPGKFWNLHTANLRFRPLPSIKPPPLEEAPILKLFMSSLPSNKPPWDLIEFYLKLKRRNIWIDSNEDKKEYEICYYLSTVAGKNLEIYISEMPRNLLNWIQLTEMTWAGHSFSGCLVNPPSSGEGCIPPTYLPWWLETKRCKN